MNNLNLAVGLTLITLLVPEGTQAQPVVTRYTIDGGGGTSQAAGTSISGTIGQPDAGEQAGGGYQLSGGFWVGAPGPPPATPTPTSTGIAPTRTPTPTGTSISTTPTRTPTATSTGAASTPTPTATSMGISFDVKPDPLDGFIDALDLIEWFTRVKTPEGDPRLLFELSLHWQDEFPPPGKADEMNE